MTTIELTGDGTPAQKPGLVRSLSLPLAVLFGLGVTIGAGIYVLIGATAGRAGMHAPLAFLIAALVMAPTAASFAELASRLPVSAGEAAYVGAGFRSEFLARGVGLMVIAVGIISAAAIAKGSAGYIREFVTLPAAAITAIVILAMGAVAAWGILLSVSVAALMTLIEIGGTPRHHRHRRGNLACDPHAPAGNMDGLQRHPGDIRRPVSVAVGILCLHRF